MPFFLPSVLYISPTLHYFLLFTSSLSLCLLSAISSHPFLAETEVWLSNRHLRQQGSATLLELPLLGRQFKQEGTRELDAPRDAGGRIYLVQVRRCWSQCFCLFLLHWCKKWCRVKVCLLSLCCYLLLFIACRCLLSEVSARETWHGNVKVPGRRPTATCEVPGLKLTAQCVTRSRRGKEPLHLSDTARLLAPVSGIRVERKSQSNQARPQLQHTQAPA